VQQITAPMRRRLSLNVGHNFSFVG
jgi:hypothetical protein